MRDVILTLHAKPLGVSKLDQLIPINKEVNKKEQLEKRAGGGGGKKTMYVLTQLPLVTLVKNWWLFLLSKAQP
jgi:hypothetical protein